MKRAPVILLLVFGIFLAACQSLEVDLTENVDEQTVSAPVPTNLYQTGVHLQGLFALPDWLRSLEPLETEMEYLIYLPDGYNEEPDKLWPLIVFLHGSGDDDFDSAWVMSSGLPEVLFNDDQPENFEFIVLSPQSFDSTTWWDRVTPTVVDSLVEEITSSYKVDASRVYLTGLSMGGYGSWYVAAANPDRYAAMASISGSGYRTTTIPDEEFMCQIEDVPLWAIHGAKDQISHPNANRIFLEAYQELCVGEVNITFYPEEGHFGAFYRAYRDPALYDWFLEHSKEQRLTSE